MGTELANATNNDITILGDMLRSGNGFYTSMPQETDEEAVALFNATTANGKRIKDMINKEFTVEHVILESVAMTNDKTGAIENQIRTVLVTPNGDTYGCMSRGVFGSIVRIMNMARFGPPPWKPGLLFESYMTAGGNGDVLSIRLLGRAKK